MIRRGTPKDALAIATVYHDSVRQINSRDYAEAQIDAWAGAAPDEDKWLQRQDSRITLVDERNGVIRGFAELENEGHIGAIYVHPGYERKGVASALLDQLEKEALARGATCLSTEASITAQPFFAKHGFENVAAQDVDYCGRTFRNYRMRKQLSSSVKASIFQA
jgi:putative acetyltransferase